MARIRTIKPEFWVSEQLAECSSNARLTFVGMWSFCDDRGVHPAKPKTLKAELYPMDDIAATQVGEWVAELVRVGLVREFVALEDGERYWHVTGWDRHQRIDRPSIKHPPPPPLDSTNPRRVVAEDSSSATPRKGMERKGEEGSGVDGRSPKARAPSVFDAGEIDLPDWLPREAWKAWVADRKERRKPITERAAAAQIDALSQYRAQGHQPADVIRHSIAGGYQGLFPPNGSGRGAGSRPAGKPILDCDEVFGGVST
jgi:hypothetical protein